MVEPLKIFKLVGDSEMPVPWAGPAVQVAWRLNELPHAEVDAALAEGWAVDTGEGLRPLQELVRDDEVYRIRTDRGGGAGPDDVLFDGFIQRVGYGVDARGRRATLRMIHIADVLRTERRYHVRGQLWLDRAGLEGLTSTPPTHTLTSVIPREVPALECVFNPRGQQNCYKDILRPPSIGGIEADYLPVFTWPRKPDAKWWTWARVLLYLLGLPRLETVGGQPRLGELTAYKFIELAGADGQTLTQRILAGNYHRMEPDDPAAPETPWAQALLGRPNGHSLEGLDWLTAWRYTLARCGLIWSMEPSQIDEHVRWGLRVEHPDQLQALTVRLPTPAWKSYDKPWQETLERAANVAMLDVEADYDLVNSLGPSGAEDRREITVELVPGWRENADWDVDPANGEQIAAAVAQLATPGWEDRYTLHGMGTSPLGDEGLWNVGRLWGLNTHDAWRNYGRNWLPWIKPQPGPPSQPGAYKLFDLADVRLARQTGQPPMFVHGESTVRPRALGNCLSGLTSRTPLPPFVEISFDEGQHWRTCTAGAEASTWDLRIWLGADDLRGETQTNPAWPNAGMSLPEAYIRGLLRLRVTGTIVTDSRFGYAALALTGHTLSGRERHRVLQRPLQWAMARRDDYEGIPMGNSALNTELYPAAPDRPVAGFRDDYEVAERDMRRLLRSLDRVIWRGAVEIPWLEYVVVDTLGQVTQGYRPAAALAGLQCESAGEPQNPEYYRLDFQAAIPEEAVGALIGEIVWSYRQDPPAASTRLNLEDRSRLVNLGGVH